MQQYHHNMKSKSIKWRWSPSILKWYKGSIVKQKNHCKWPWKLMHTDVVVMQRKVTGWKYQLQSTEKPGNGAPVPDLDNSTKSCMRLKPQKMCLKAVTRSDQINPICQTSTSVGVGVLIATVLGFDVGKSEMICANPHHTANPFSALTIYTPYQPRSSNQVEKRARRDWDLCIFGDVFWKRGLMVWLVWLKSKCFWRSERHKMTT